MNNFTPFYYPNYQTYQQPAQPQNTDERIWVQGINSAEAYLVAPNSFVRLWDSSCNRFYEKRADASGRPLPLEIYEYSRIEASNTPSPTIDYSAEIEGLKARISALESIKKEVKKNVPKSNATDTGIPEV